VSEYDDRGDVWTEAEAARNEPAEPREDGARGDRRASEPINTVSELIRRVRWPLLVVLVVVAAAAATALTVPRDGDTARLGPANPAPAGSRAVIQVLRRQGVDVQALRNSRAVETAVQKAASGGGSTVVVTHTELLGPDQLDLLAKQRADLVLVEPDEVTLATIVPSVRTAGVAAAQNRDPACADEGAGTAGRVRAGGHQYVLVLDGNGGDGQLCYPDGSATGSDTGSATGVGGVRGGSYVTTRLDGRTVTVIGQSDVLTNRYVGESGNAALALRALGAEPVLVWYTPDPLELALGRQPPSLRSLLPDWVLWVVVQLVIVILVAMAWRARRLGRLVPEPLPVVVRSAETTEGRARLYRQASARGRAAATLRTGTLRRLATRFAAPPGTSPEQLVTLVAAATGRDETPLRHLLLGGTPGSDGALVSLADDLDAAEQEAERP
jgi:hypothetical protein